MNSDSDLDNEDDNDMVQRQQIYSEEDSPKTSSKQDSLSKESKPEDSSSGFHTQNSAKKVEENESVSSGTLSHSYF